MTPEERDRLRTLEVKVSGLEDWLKSIDGKVDEIREAAHMGKGAWLLLLKLGAVLAALATAGAWMWGQFGGKHP